MQASQNGSVMVVGGGIAGIQAALDLAETGFYVYLVEKSPAIGGTMPVLDKTFPTNDCSMCILSPKLVECGRHMNIEVLTNTEVQRIEGVPGNFKVSLYHKARRVDMDECTGCGTCAENCPSNVDDEFDQGLDKRKAIYRPYAQAYPKAFAIDPENCIECGTCEEECPAGAIDLSMQDDESEINTGAVILAIGSAAYDPQKLDYYDYGRNPGVLTSLEFERVLSASGPFGGKLKRPFDGKEPEKIAWIQCVGSRNMKENRNYCSSVCCMYAVKEAVIAREHSNIPLDTAIFMMDMRAYGKDFENYYTAAVEEHGVRFIRSRVFSLDRTGDGGVYIRYAKENGEVTGEKFDLAVLSTGLEPPREMVDLAGRAGIKLNNYNFCEPVKFSGVETNRPGIYTAGTISKPQDIPETVTQACAAAASASALLAGARNSMTQERELPPESDVSSEEVRTGVFVCHCGINIGSVVDVPAVVDYAGNLPGVVHSEGNLFTCSQDMQQRIRYLIKKMGLNRVVVASCTPRTHEPLFRETLREAGLNPYLLEMANIREHCSWVHSQDSEAATEKAKTIVARAAARCSLQNPLGEMEIQIDKVALVVGGGVSGMNGALELARQGVRVYLVEKSGQLGGIASRIHYTAEGYDVQSYLNNLTDEVYNHRMIDVYTNTQVSEVSGYTGNYRTTISGPGGKLQEITHGAAVIAVGGREYIPEEYLYNRDSRVMTALELENAIVESSEAVQKANNVVMIQCVGSRREDRQYCSRVCCTESVKNALKLKELNPRVNIFVFYRDMRTYGFSEELYYEARRKGVIFIRYNELEKPRVEQVEENGEIKLRILARDPVLDAPVSIDADLVALAAGISPPEDGAELSRLFKVPRNGDGFFLEAHMKLRPVDFTADGIYLCGIAHAPKTIEESITQGKAAAVRAMNVLARDTLTTGGAVSEIDREKCSGCAICISVCPYSAVSLNKEYGTAEVNQALCKGCGICAGACPSGACTVGNFDSEIIMEEIKALCG